MKTGQGQLNGKGYYYAFLAGAKRILENQKELEPDQRLPRSRRGYGIQSRLDRPGHHRARPAATAPSKSTSSAIAAAALEGARGNSGVIFAQFLYGIGAESSGGHEVSIGHFAQAVQKAVRYMYEAIAEPKEGTMITVIRRWAESVAAHQKEDAGSFLKVLTRSYDRALEALHETRHKLEAMRRANVVDAGSKGMVLFLEGMIDFLKKPSHKKIVSVRKDAAVIEDVAEVPSGPVRLRYCTEALIKPLSGRGASGLDKEALKREISGFGDSLVVAGSKDALRFHIHTDTPAEMFFRIRDFGAIVFQKADDMLRQYEAAHRRKWSIALVTDSCCDLPPDVLDHYQIHVVPTQLSFGDSPYIDKVTITPDQFYTMLDERKDLPTTAQPTPEAFEDMFARLAGHYDSIVAVHLAQKLSGTYSNSLKAAERVSRETGTKITVIDSRTLSGALGHIVLRLARSIEAGRSHEEIVADAERILPNAKVLVAVRTLKSLVRSGRVSRMTGVLANLLNLKPIVSIGPDGGSRIFDKAFSQRGSIKKILGHATKYAAKFRILEYGLLHVHNPEGALAYAAEVGKIFGREPAFILDISPVIGLHVGSGAVAVSFLLDD